MKKLIALLTMVVLGACSSTSETLFASDEAKTNDVKTTSEKYIPGFKEETGHFYSYSYYRQFYFYSQLLKEYCREKYGYDDTWEFKSNVIVIQTVEPFYTKVFPVTEEDYKLGELDFEQLLKQVAYYEINGWDKDVTFICE